MTTDYSKSYLGYSNNLVDEYNNTYRLSVGMIEEAKQSYKAPTFKVGIRVKITKYRNIFGKAYTKNQSREILDSVLKTNPWTYKIEDLIKEKIIISFYEKELLLSKLYRTVQTYQRVKVIRLAK